MHDLIASLEASGALKDPEAFYVTMLTLLGRYQEANVTALDRRGTRSLMEMARRLTFKEAEELVRSFPVSIGISYGTGRPFMSRTDWERLPRSRRIRDWLLGRHPPKGLGERPSTGS